MMSSWQDQLAHSITDPVQLAGHFELDGPARKACEAFPVRLTPYVLSLAARSPAVARQFVPDGAELADSGPSDPLGEENARPVPFIIHRYPDRLLLMAADACPANCRFCTRRGRVGEGPEKGRTPGAIPTQRIDEAVEYVRSKPHVREVILSGGEPLLLEDDDLIGLLDRLRSIQHVRVVRIHSRAAATLPMRITSELCKGLKDRQPLYVNVHFNHPDELTEEALHACRMLADAGIPLGNQSVLLRGVNDSPEVMQKLVEKLLEARVRPYYLHHPDGTRGTGHFNVNASRGLEIMAHLRARCSGLAVPQYVKDEPGAPFKRPLCEF